MEHQSQHLVPQFEEIYKSYYERIRLYLARTVGPIDAEDLAQEVFIKVSASLDTFKGNSSIYTWIYRIATNLMIDTMRKNTVSCDKCYLSDKVLFRKEESDYCTDEFRIAQKEMNECICSYIKKLQPNYRIAIILKEYESAGIDEIAVIMNVTKGNAKKILMRARQKLRSILLEQCSFYYNEQNILACEQK